MDRWTADTRAAQVGLSRREKRAVVFAFIPVSRLRAIAVIRSKVSVTL
jgi:hypothetical protein